MECCTLVLGLSDAQAPATGTEETEGDLDG